MKATNKRILVAILATVLPGTACAATSVNEGYLKDVEGSIVRNGSGGCWHTSIWTTTMAVSECDPGDIKVKPPIIVRPLPTPISMPAPISMPPPQVSVPVQAKIFSKKFTFSEEGFFSFNESELRPKGKAKMDNLVHELEGAKYEIIHVIGYTDRIGSTGYNQKLSMRRADEVKDYLVSKGIPADLIKAEGKGETEPVTNPKNCRGKSSAEDIACLQPDRRTEVTVDGIRLSEADPR